MVTKRVRSEYMKKFKDPKWETYARCYEEMLKYRLTRRLLEHTHNPWFWSGSDSDSDSGRSPPPRSNQVGIEPSKARREAGPEHTSTVAQQELEVRSTGPVSKLPIKAKEHEGTQQDKERETQVMVEDKEEEADDEIRSLLPSGSSEKVTKGARPKQRKQPKSTKANRHMQRVMPAPPWPPRDDQKDVRHPFALYGSGERNANVASRKTHNVGPAASTKEIHESALRAKTRREVEREIQNQRSEQRRARSADLDRTRKLLEPEYNPWLSEYMRCFSARSR